MGYTVGRVKWGWVWGQKIVDNLWTSTDMTLWSWCVEAASFLSDVQPLILVRVSAPDLHYSQERPLAKVGRMCLLYFIVQV